MSHTYWELGAAMCRTGMLGFGGGPSIVPLIRHEAVVRYRWLSDDEFGEALAIASALPGPIATKLSAYLGYRLKGALGAAYAVACHIIPTSVAMVGLYAFIAFFSASPVVRGMIAAVVPVIAVMLGVIAYEFAEKAAKGLGYAAGSALAALVFALLQWADLHPALVIAAFLVCGAFRHRLPARRRPTKKSEPDEGGGA